MSSCTFFGHRTVKDNIKEILTQQIERLIIEHSVSIFYVGNQGGFDRLTASVLKELKTKYPHISYYIVLAYLPERCNASDPCSYTETIYPEILEHTPKRFAISKRNQWMVNQAEYVITYVEHSFGGAAQFAEYARKKHKAVINLVESKENI